MLARNRAGEMNWVVTGVPFTRTEDCAVKLRPFTSTSAGPWVTKSAAGSKLGVVGRLRSTGIAAGTRISPASPRSVHPGAPGPGPPAAGGREFQLGVGGPGRGFALRPLPPQAPQRA